MDRGTFLANQHNIKLIYLTAVILYMAQATQVVVNTSPPRVQENPLSSIASGNMIPQMSSEGYKLIDKLLDSNTLWLDKLTTLLYCAHLVKDSVPDPDSPIPGFRLVKIGGEAKWKPNVNLVGYTTVVSEILLAINVEGSITRFPDDFLLQRFASRQTMAIVGLMLSNRSDYAFQNYTIIYPFGLTLWKALVAILSRSVAGPGKTTLMDKIMSPMLWLGQNNSQAETPNKKWFNI